jgi:neurofibromin 1
MAREAQLAIAIPLRSAIWNWIECHPSEFNETLRNGTRTSTIPQSGRSKTDGAPERVFELLCTKLKPGVEERIVWPTLTAICCMISERLAMDYIRFGGGRVPVQGGQGHKISHRKVSETVL